MQGIGKHYKVIIRVKTSGVVIEEMKQKILAITAKVRRYQERVDRFRLNRMFQNNQRQFYKEFNEEREKCNDDSNDKQSYLEQLYTIPSQTQILISVIPFLNQKIYLKKVPYRWLNLGLLLLGWFRLCASQKFNSHFTDFGQVKKFIIILILWTSQKISAFSLYKTLLGETGCLGNPYFLLTGCLNIQFFDSPPFFNTVSQAVFGYLAMTARHLYDLQDPMPHHWSPSASHLSL